MANFEGFDRIVQNEPLISVFFFIWAFHFSLLYSIFNPHGYKNLWFTKTWVGLECYTISKWQQNNTIFFVKIIGYANPKISNYEKKGPVTFWEKRILWTARDDFQGQNITNGLCCCYFTGHSTFGRLLKFIEVWKK